MRVLEKMNYLILLLTLSLFSNCDDKTPTPDIIIPDPTEQKEFYFGADLSYVNQILDHGGIFKDSSDIESPYATFSQYGNNLARFRLWHNPSWTKELYGASGKQLYNDLKDVEKSIRLSKTQGMSVLLDFHFSDTWADPGSQRIPAAWMDITSIEVLVDSVYNYTFKTLTYLNAKGLMPEFVQIGNETNCGMMYSNAAKDFPPCNVCDDHWDNFSAVVKSGIKAINDVATNSDVKTKIILHVADPKNVDWWFTKAAELGVVSSIDIIGFSYYPIWHTTVGLSLLETTVAGFKSKFGKDVMIMEIAYPWTSNANDSYNNQFGSTGAISGFPFTPQGQLGLLKSVTQHVVDGGGLGVIYWEPAWITSNMKDSWNTGSSWENNAFYDFDGNTNQAFDYLTFDYGLE